MTSTRLSIALAVGIFLISATWAMNGRHVPSGHEGFVGHEAAGIRGTGNTGVYGTGTTWGVFGDSTNGVGVDGRSTSFVGVFGSSVNGQDATGVVGIVPETGVGIGVMGDALHPQSWAGYFFGDVAIDGTLVKSAGSFRIDHPLDPANKYLSHSFVESPDMKNIYDGVIVLDGAGEAVVELPAWFESLNEDFRYQLTCIGESAPVYIAQEIANNRFRIAGGHGSMKVSWQVTGSRKDPYAVANPIVVEEFKAPRERGTFIHPELYGLSRAAAVKHDVQQRNRKIQGLRRR